MSTAIATTAQLQLVRIRGGMYRGKEFSGVYPYIGYTQNNQRGKCVQIKSGDKMPWINVDHGTFEILDEGANIQYDSINGMPAATIAPGLHTNTKLTEAQVEKIIEERFDVMDSLIRALRVSRIRSVIITGAAGIGKTYNVEAYLEKMELEEGQHWAEIGGKCSAFGLYEALWSCRNEGSIMVLDDVEVWEDIDCLNILKKALDTNKRRIIDWRTASKALEDKGLPDSFEFKGKVIFLTNVDAYKEISRGSKKAPHLNALISRSVFLDLGIHDPRTILLHVRSVTRKVGMLVERGLTDFQQEQALMWLEENVNNLQALSLRTPLMIGEFMLTEKEKWEAMCQHTLLQSAPLNW